MEKIVLGSNDRYNLEPVLVITKTKDVSVKFAEWLNGTTVEYKALGGVHICKTYNVELKTYEIAFDHFINKIYNF